MAFWRSSILRPRSSMPAVACLSCTSSVRICSVSPSRLRRSACFFMKSMYVHASMPSSTHTNVSSRTPNFISPSLSSWSSGLCPALLARRRRRRQVDGGGLGLLAAHGVDFSRGVQHHLDLEPAELLIDALEFLADDEVYVLEQLGAVQPR